MFHCDGDEIGKWHSCYDPTSEEEIEWLMYVADLLANEDDDGTDLPVADNIPQE